MKRRVVAIGFLTALACGGVDAAELEYGFEAGVGTTDNIRRAPVGEQDETILTAGVDFALTREEGRMHADVDVDLSYFDYEDETYGGEVTGMAQADLRFLIVPGRFEWVLLDSFGQSQLDPFVPVTPDNLENFNYATTGPDVTLRLGSTGRITLFGRYSETQFEDSGLDDERLLGGLSLGRELSPRSEISLNATSERVEFDDPALAGGYDRQSAFIRYETEGARTNIGVEAGYTELHDNGSTNSSPLFEIEVSRELSARTSLTLRGTVRSSDASTALRGGEVGGGFPGVPEQVSTADPFETSQVSLGWNFVAQRTSVFLSATHDESRYESATSLDRQRQLYQALIRRQFTPRVSVAAQASHATTDYDSALQEDDDTQFGLSLSWNFTGRLFLDFSVNQFERDSTNPLTDFEETRAFVRLAWRSAGTPGN